MENRKIIEEVVKQVEGTLGAPLSDEEKSEIYLWQKSSALRELTSLPGWEVIKEMFQDYVEDAKNDFSDLIMKDPFKAKDQLEVKHTYAYTVNRVVNAFFEDINNSVQFSDKPPDVIKRAAQRLKK